MINIRDFQYADIEPLIHIAQLSFAKEYLGQGETPESFVRQIQLVARGRMIPFKLLTRLMGLKWRFFVAEVEGHIVGFGSYIGHHHHMELANLMVHPEYRRHGIGQALLLTRLTHLKTAGFPLVTTTILASNAPSLGNVRKQGFVVFDQYTFMEKSVSDLLQENSRTQSLDSRPFLKTDRTSFITLEEQISHPDWLRIQGTALSNYTTSPGKQLMNRLTNTQKWTRSFSTPAGTVGFLSMQSTGSQSTGILTRPVIHDEHTDHLPMMLQEAAKWLAERGKKTLQISIPGNRPLLLEQMLTNGWTPTQDWVRLVKYLIP